MTPEFHRAVCSWRQRTPFQRNLYLLPRDHLKTSLLNVAANVQRIIRNPQARILLASNKAEAAEAQLSEIKGHLVNPRLVWLFPDVLYANPEKESEEWTRSSITVRRSRRTKEATIETIGVEGAATGKHYDHGTFDDLVDEQNSKTRALLEATIHWYKTTQSLFEPQATQDVIGTSWAFGDLYDWLIQRKLKREISLGVYRQPCWVVREPGVLRVDTRGGIAPDDLVLDAQHLPLPAYSEKFTRERLDERRQDIGAALFAAQYLLRPVDDESAVFPRGKAVIAPRHTMPDPSSMWCVMAVDPAISTKDWADYSALAVTGFDSAGQAYVLDLRRGRWAESELIDQVYDAYRSTPNVRVIGFEAVGFQKLYLREFARAGETRGFLPLLKLERDTRVTKAIRIRSLEPLWTNGQLVLADDLPVLDDFLEEAERFRPWKESMHDDMLDALADCLQLRVRPEPENPDDGLDEVEAERRQFERELQHDSRPMDRASVRNAWGMHRRRQAWQEARDAEILGATAPNEFFSG
jgi:predicted phage terminase large subunit-like protein